MAFTVNFTMRHIIWSLLIFFFQVKEFVQPVFILQDSVLDSVPVITGLNKDIRVFRGNLSAQDFFHQPYLEDSYFLIGARNVVYNISLSSLAENKRLTWYSSSQDVDLCLMRQKTPLECQNYIRVISKVAKDEYLICGTNAFRPLCRTYHPGQKRTYSFVNEENGVARCPYDPAHNSTAVYVGKRLYSATVADLSARDSLIFSKPLRTEQHDSQWLNDPNFVSSFAHDNKVYFFFRETAVENINCGKAVFSRVARVCTKDTGGSRVLRNTWTSFFKARLNCSIPGEFPFYFDEIQSTSDLGEGNLFPTLIHSDRIPLVYALFSTPRNSLRGTAICAYKFSDVISVFEGAYKEQRTAYSNWLPVRESDVPEPHPAKSCPNDSQILSDQTLNFIKSHPLMDKTVPAFGGQPLIVQTSLSYSFTTIAIDWQVHAADHRYYDVIFIGTDNGRVLKVLNKGHGPNIDTVIVEVLVLFPNGDPITSLKISKSHGRIHKKLIAVSREEIRAVSLHRCHLKTTCSSCIGMKDPYCSWHDGECVNSDRGVQSIETGRHTKCSTDFNAGSPSVTFHGSSRSGGSCPPCVCKESSVNHAPMKSNSLRSDDDDDDDGWQPKMTPGSVKQQRAMVPRLATEKDDKLEEDEMEEGENEGHYSKVASLDDQTGSISCIGRQEGENDGYSLAVLLLVAFLPSIFTFIFGILIGCYLAIHRRSQFFQVTESCPSAEKALCDDGTKKQDSLDPQNSEQRYKVVVNELKSNNSKQPNGSAESSLQKASINYCT